MSSETNKKREIIAELDRQAKEKEQQFFERIASQLGRPRIEEPPVQPIRGVPSFWQEYDVPHEKRIEMFMNNWEKLGGVAKRFATPELLVSYIKEVVESMEAKRMIRSVHPLMDTLAIDDSLPVEMTIWQRGNEGESGGDSATEHSLMEIAARADIGLTVVDYAIAYTGTVVVTSGERKGRSISLLPTSFMAIIQAKDIKTRMGEVLTDFTPWSKEELPAGIHFITGPSRSADIENDLTIGVHGPGIVYALVLD